jgi:hypothetical protein
MTPASPQKALKVQKGKRTIFKNRRSGPSLLNRTQHDFNFSVKIVAIGLGLSVTYAFSVRR